MRARLKILFAGLGSIGQRHVRNVRMLLGDSVDILAYRSRRQSPLVNPDMTAQAGADVKGAYDIRSFDNLEDALAENPDAVFVTNPNSLHLAVALEAARAGCHLFIEKPISDSFEKMDQLIELVERKRLVVFVGYQFRFHPGLHVVKDLLDQGAVGATVSVHVHYGEYLPNWHPWEDYRCSYSARVDLGGGVLLTLCHPFDYLRWLMGEVTEVSALVARRSVLGIGVEETADINLRFANDALGHVHLSYIVRPPSHRLQIIGRTGTIHWDNTDGSVRCYRTETGIEKTYAVPDSFYRNTMFLGEMTHFLGCIEGNEQPVCTLDDGIQALRMALAAKQSATEGRTIKLSDERRLEDF